MYQINGEEHVLEWMRGASAEECEAMLAWLPRLATDPEGAATATRKRPGVPAYTAAVPGTIAFVDYTVVEQYATILILRVSDQPLDAGA